MCVIVVVVFLGGVVVVCVFSIGILKADKVSMLFIHYTGSHEFPCNANKAVHTNKNQAETA